MKRLLIALAAQCALMLALGMGPALAGGLPVPGQGGPPGDQPSLVTQIGNTATGGNGGSASGGSGGDANSGNIVLLSGNSVAIGGDASGGDTVVKSGDATGGDGGNASADGGDAASGVAVVHDGRSVRRSVLWLREQARERPEL